MSADYDRLHILFSRVRNLPELPRSVQRLIETIDTGEASARDLERIISADPALCVSILRVANTYRGNREEVATIRTALLLLGQSVVRNLATSWMMQRILSRGDVAPEFSRHRYASHCLVTAYTARYIYARKQMNEGLQTTWTADEVFAAALLHDVGVALLACVAPHSYQRIYAAASRFKISIAESFRRTYERGLEELAAHALETWSLPPIFVQAVGYQFEPWSLLEEFGGLACINYADYLSCVFGCTLEPWVIHPDLGWEVQKTVGLPDEEAAQVLHTVSEMAFPHVEAEIQEAA